MQRLDEIDGEAESSYQLTEAEASAVAPADGLGGLVADLDRESEANQRRFRIFSRFLIGLVAGVAGGSLVWLFAEAEGLVQSRGIGALFALFGLVGPATAVYVATTKRHRRLARQVAHCDDMRALGPLIASINLPGNRVQREVAEAVTRMLPHLDEAAVDHLTSIQIDMLNYQIRRAAIDPLSYSTNVDHLRDTAGQNCYYRLLQAILEAAPLFGNNETLKHLERLAATRGRAIRRGGVPRPARRADLAAAAMLAAERVRERLDRNVASAQLLRPAESTESGGLLRPAGFTDGPRADLLRASDAGEQNSDSSAGISNVLT